MDDFRRFFLRGLGALGPTLLTIAILVWVYSFVNEYFGTFVTRGLVLICSSVSQEPAPGLVNEDRDPLRYGQPIDEWDEYGRRLTVEYKIIHHKILGDRVSPPAGVSQVIWQRAVKARNEAMWQIASVKYRLHLLGFLIAIIFVYFVGFFLASFLGRAVWRGAEGVLYRIPLIRAIYPHVKQITDFVLSEKKALEVSGVVAVQYPRKGIWSLGLSTGGALPRIQEDYEVELVSVFIPSSPTPVTGYVIQLPREDVIELDLTIDQALRFTVSGGVIKPGADLPDSLKALEVGPAGGDNSGVDGAGDGAGDDGGDDSGSDAGSDSGSDDGADDGAGKK
ncbi:MAG: DUF502 domain-containing protein [Planctomycetota bacterium]|jgi:uncharacterized membrane protein